MEELVRYINTLYIKFECGRTPKDNIAHKTMKVPGVGQKFSASEIRELVGIIALALAGPVVSIELAHDRIKTILTPQMREEAKLQQELAEQRVSEARSTLARLEAQTERMISVPTRTVTSDHTALRAMSETDLAQTNPTIYGEANQTYLHGTANPMYLHGQANPLCLHGTPHVVTLGDGQTKIDLSAILAAHPELRAVEPTRTTAVVGYEPPLSYLDIPGYNVHAPGL